MSNLPRKVRFYNTTPQPNSSCYTFPQHARDPKIRFILLILGPAGSGKSRMAQYMKYYAQLINSSAARKPWVEEEISHDYFITQQRGWQARSKGGNPGKWKTYKHTYKKQFDRIYNRATGEGGADAVGDDEDEVWKQAASGPAGPKGGANTTTVATHAANTIINTPTHQQAMNEAYRKTRVDESPDTMAKKEQFIAHHGNQGEAKWKAYRRKYGFHQAGIPSRLSLVQRPLLRYAPDILVYHNLVKFIEKGNNIIYEATGEKWETMLEIFDALVRKTNACNKYKYIVMASLNLISVSVNKDRIDTRFRKQMQHYVTREHEEKRYHVPRLPNSNRENISQRNNNIYRKINTLIKQCTESEQKKSRGKCRGVGIDLLFLFDQNRIIKYSLEEDKNALTRASEALTAARRDHRRMGRIAGSRRKTREQQRKIDAARQAVANAQSELRMRIQTAQITPIAIIPLSLRAKQITSVGKTAALTYTPQQKATVKRVFGEIAQNVRPSIPVPDVAGIPRPPTADEVAAAAAADHRQQPLPELPLDTEGDWHEPPSPLDAFIQSATTQRTWKGGTRRTRRSAKKVRTQRHRKKSKRTRKQRRKRRKKTRKHSH